QRDDRPGHLVLGVFMEVRRLRTLGTAMGDHRIDHHAEYQRTDDHADPEDRHAQVEYGSNDIGHADWHVHVPGGMGLAEQASQPETQPKLWMSRHCGLPLWFLLSRRPLRSAEIRLSRA